MPLPIVAAIIGAIGSAAAAKMSADGQTQAANSKASQAQGGKGEFNMESVFQDAVKQAGQTLEVEKNPNVTKMNAEVAQANNPVQLGSNNFSAVNPAQPGSTGDMPALNPKKPMLPDAEIVPPGTPLPGEGAKAGMTTEDKMAMAAQLGSLLRGPGAPPPPSRGGQGINMSPVFQNVTLRNLAGG